jgi:CO dehydrogenase maturation factor
LHGEDPEVRGEHAAQDHSRGRHRADATLGAVKVAVSGKGGTGKTTIAATLARCLARRGHRVLAIDGDSNPNLALSLDLPAGEAERMRPMPARALTGSQTAADLFEQYAVPGPGGIRVVLAARIDQAGSG